MNAASRSVELLLKVAPDFDFSVWLHDFSLSRIIELVTLIALAWITFNYALTTARMARQMERQNRILIISSRIHVLSAVRTSRPARAPEIEGQLDRLLDQLMVLSETELQGSSRAPSDRSAGGSLRA